MTCAGRQHAGREQQGAPFEETPSEEQEHTQDLFQKMEFLTLCERTMRGAMQEGKAMAVADGGSKQQIGTFGVVVDWGDDKN